MATADLGLRQRKATKESSEGKSVPIQESTENFVAALAEKAPANFRPYIQKAAPICGKVAMYAEKSLPYIEKASEQAQIAWAKLEPYKPKLLLPALCGLIMCFFGGSFLTLIAAVEAYRMCGYETTVGCIRELYEDFQRLAVASAKDDAKDENNDGVPDVLQVTKQELLMRKTLLFLKTVDPKRVTNALAGINAGFLAVIATLKLQFAKAITLGNAIGSILDKPAQRYAIPFVREILPADYKQWAAPAIEYSVKSFAISIAWFVQRILSAFHSAIRGGLMFSRNIMEYLSIMKYVEINHEDTYLDEVVGYGLAFLGLSFQLSYGFALPFPLNILLLPFSIAEWFLMWVVNSK